MILVMGATGNTGKVVAARLLAGGQKVRAIGRSAKRLRELAQLGAQPAAGDARDANFLTTALVGAEAVYAMVPPDNAQPDVSVYYDVLGAAIETAIRRSEVRRMVFLSSLGAELLTGTGPIAGLHAQEERFKKLGIDLLILRPGYFFENFYGSLGLIKNMGVNGGAIEPNVKISMVATADVGAVAAKELLRASFRGIVMRELLGPRDLALEEATKIFGQAIGKSDLAYERFPDEDFRAGLVRMGFSKGMAEAFLEMSHAFNAGKIRSLEGRNRRNTTPTRFETFAQQLAAAYRAM